MRLLWWFLCAPCARVCCFYHLPHGLYVAGSPPDNPNALQDPLKFFSWVVMDIFCNSTGVWGCFDGFYALPGLGYAVFITCPMVFSSPDLLQASEISCSALYNNYFSFPGMLFVVFHTKRGLWWFSLAVLAMICRVFCILLPFWGTFEFLEQGNDGWHPLLTSSCLSICVIL